MHPLFHSLITTRSVQLSNEFYIAFLQNSHGVEVLPPPPPTPFQSCSQAEILRGYDLNPFTSEIVQSYHCSKINFCKIVKKMVPSESAAS